MPTVLDPFRFLLIALAGWMNQRLLHMIEYLREEKRVLREQLGERRLRLNDDQRRRLAARARELGLERLTAEVLPHNRRMLNLFHRSGLPVTARFRDGVVHVILDLGGEPLTDS